MFNQSLELKLKQEQKLTQKLIQKLELIPMTNIELDNLIENELMINDFLKASSPETNNAEIPKEDGNTQIIEENYDVDKEFLYAQNDWEDIRKRNTKNYDFVGEKNSFLENIPEKATDSFKKYINSELILKLENDEERDIAYFLVELLDSKGFLLYETEKACSLMIKRGENIEEKYKVVTKVRNIMMSIEPFGTGSHNIKEYLLTQIKMRNIENLLLKNIVNDYLEEISRNRIQYISTKTGYSVEEVQLSLNELRDKIPPYPSFGFAVDNTEYIKPDASIDNDGNIVIHSKYRRIWTIDLEKYKINISKYKDKETKKFMKKQYEKACELVNNYYSRNNLFEDLLKIIYREQKRFFQGGPLNPLKQIDVADELGVNVSTISRIANGKYVRTSFGTMSVGDFFVNISVGDVSSDESMIRLKEIIDGEDKKNPLSDEDIMIILNKKYNIDIKRRTVAKYRDKLGILSSRQRKDYL
ncbi:MAG: hypothetical protein M0R46_15615 [Candidatus Muirbacterium halophilum]|nr:hypothetical protein [Candidatus Muirbacterium halophilum]MCK9477344.1 hypothetical protein [Candidatus Muirbacterium halophilum]